MRISQCSTDANAFQTKSICHSQITTTSDFSLSSTSVNSPLYLVYFNQYCSQYFQLTNYLNQELIKNNFLITYRIEDRQYEQHYQHENFNNLEKNHFCFENQNASQKYNQNSSKVRAQSNKNTEKWNKKNNKVKQESEESYIPDDQCSKELGASSTSESKNIPKNYGKAIVNFILKNQVFTSKVLAHLNIDCDDFMKSLNVLKNNLKTIYQLRSMWMNSQNKYSKAYRIFSGEYLRKHSLSYIFNSRVQNIHRHIKYRYKIMQGAEKPQSFTCMKEF